MLSNVEIVYLALPIITGFAASFLCPMKDAGSDVVFRPDSWVFSVVWPILYLLLGVSWIIASRKNKLNSFVYGLLTLLLVCWIIVYSCNEDKKNAVFVLLASLMAALSCFAIGNKTSKILISPLIGWLIFATIMNTTEVQNKG